MVQQEVAFVVGHEDPSLLGREEQLLVVRGPLLVKLARRDDVMTVLS
jgi:hypothetical protein